jgi:gamma-glutamyltranspeptidase/glutathione hydrolase
MSPTLVFERGPDGSTGRLVMSLGSPGGAAIIHFTAKTLLGTLAWGLDVQHAIALPNAGSFNGPTLLEAGRFPAATVQALQQRGHVVQQIALPSGIQALQRWPGLGWLGGADPRRDGAVAGE